MAETTDTTDPHLHVDAAAAVHGEHAHPTEGEYVRIALILGVITAIEVAIYYVESIKDFLVPILLVLAVAKFSMVALWFMHLKFDSKLFRRFFVTGIVLAIGVYTIFLFSLHVLD